MRILGIDRIQIERLTSFFSLPLILGAAACSSATPGNPQAPDGADAGSQQDANVSPGEDASAPPISMGDAGSGQATFVSNTPGATVVDVGNPATPDLVLLS